MMYTLNLYSIVCQLHLNKTGRGGNIPYIQHHLASQVTLAVKNPSDNAGDIRDTGSIPGWKDHLVAGMATCYSIIP